MGRNKSVYVALERSIEEANEEYREILFKCMSKAMKMTKADVKQRSPGKGDYRNGWAVRTKRLKYGFEGVIYNKDHPGLTHLLEKPHVIKNGDGSYGRTSPGHGQVIHIEPAREQAEEYLIQLMMDSFEN